jgi:GNAT superfamily N-acetyltransferase
MAAMTFHDPLLVWAQQGGRPGVRVFTHGDATAVACANLSRRDRVAVAGSVPDVVALLSEVLPELGPTYRPLGDEALIAAVAPAVPGLEIAGRFAWMDTTRETWMDINRAVGAGRGTWLRDTGEVVELLEEAFPRSYAWPGGDGVRRWAGIHDGQGLVATAAEAWSVPEIGFLAGVATRPDARGRGLATAICSFVTGALLGEHDRIALFADYWNVAAIATYTRLGFGLRSLAAAKLGG